MNEIDIAKGWKKVKLKEVLKEVNERNKDEKIKRVLSVTNSRGFVSQEEYFEGTVHSANISNYKIVRKNQFAYNPSRVNVGSIDILKDYDYGALSPMYVVFEVDTIKLLPDYFKYYFQTNRFFENVKNNTQGSVRNSLSFKALADFDYLLPPIEEQEKIVKILQMIDRIIKKYGNLLEEKNQFSNSQFIEIFKDVNKYKTLKEICEFVTVGIANSVTHAYRENGIVMLRNQNILINKLDDSDLIYIDKEFANKYKNKKLLEDDILVTRTGYPGIACLVPKKYEGSQTFTTLIARLIKDKNLNPIYICHYINSKYGKQFVNSNKVGIAQQNLGAKTFELMPIKIPPIELQNKFVNMVKLIDKEKILLERQIINYEKLKKGLMQKLLAGKVKLNV